MSWPEIKKAVNSNFNKPLNEKLIEFSFPQIYVFSNSTTFTPPKNGLYKIICIGAGNSPSQDTVSGAAGGVAIKTQELSSASSYSISIANGAVFNNAIYGNGATQLSSAYNYRCVGGTALGGDFNFAGGDGVYRYRPVDGTYDNGASVGVFLHGISDKYAYTLKTPRDADDPVTLYGGHGILGFGSGEAYASIYSNGYYVARSPHGNAGVIIIPLDLDL